MPVSVLRGLEHQCFTGFMSNASRVQGSLGTMRLLSLPHLCAEIDIFSLGIASSDLAASYCTGRSLIQVHMVNRRIYILYSTELWARKYAKEACAPTSYNLPRPDSYQRGLFFLLFLTDPGPLQAATDSVSANF